MTAELWQIQLASQESVSSVAGPPYLGTCHNYGVRRPNGSHRPLFSWRVSRTAAPPQGGAPSTPGARPRLFAARLRRTVFAVWAEERYLPWEEEGHAHPDSQLERRLHSPTYLRAVIAEYEGLRDGTAQPDAALAARCESIAGARSEIADDRQRKLADPWWRATTPEMRGYSYEVLADLYDPDYLQARVDHADELDQPFSRKGIEKRAKATEAPYN
jgi:hypothetical protein